MRLSIGNPLYRFVEGPLSQTLRSFLDLFGRRFSGPSASRDTEQRVVQRARQRALHESCLVIAAEFRDLLRLSFFNTFFFAGPSTRARALRVRLLENISLCLGVCPYVP